MRSDDLKSIDHPVQDSSRGFFQSNRPQIDQDASRHLVRALSALGTQKFAAPEVKNKARSSGANEESSHKTLNSTLASCVSDYGMIADAFSVGATARFILTGVPPHENVEEFIANYNNPCNQATRWIVRKFARSAESKPKKKYRSSSGLPLEALRLVKGMTQPNASMRTSVRDAMRYPYISEVVGGTVPFKKKISFLKCAQSQI